MTTSGVTDLELRGAELPVDDAELPVHDAEAWRDDAELPVHDAEAWRDDAELHVDAPRHGVTTPSFTSMRRGMAR